MQILFHDVIQLSNAPASLRSAALADIWTGGSLVIQLDGPRKITCVGIGNTDAREIHLAFNLVEPVIMDGNTDGYAYNIYDGGQGLTRYDLDIDSNIDSAIGAASQTVLFSENGLYRIAPVITNRITITIDGLYMGRFGAGIAVELRTAITKEPGWASTAETRKTLSGQIIPGADGYTYRTVSLDTHYKINKTAMDQIAAAYDQQIGRGFPYFLLFDTEANRLPFVRLYARDAKTQEYVFQGGINKRLFSRKFDFEECF